MKSKAPKAKKEPPKPGQSRGIIATQKTFSTKLLASIMGDVFDAECYQIISDVGFLDVYTNPALSEPEDNTGSRLAFVGNSIKAMRAMRPIAEAILKEDPRIFKRMVKYLEYRQVAHLEQPKHLLAYKLALYYDTQRWLIENGKRTDPITRRELLKYIKSIGFKMTENNFNRYWKALDWPFKTERGRRNDDMPSLGVDWPPPLKKIDGVWVVKSNTRTKAEHSSRKPC